MKILSQDSHHPICIQIAAISEKDMEPPRANAAGRRTYFISPSGDRQLGSRLPKVSTPGLDNGTIILARQAKIDCLLQESLVLEREGKWAVRFFP